jgi:hypothetical protein
MRRKEIIDNFKIKFDSIVDDAGSLVNDLIDNKQRPKLLLNIDATHSGRLTNNRVYPGVHVRESVDTFTKPQPRPVLKNHNDGGDPIGRVKRAKFFQLKQGKSFEKDFLRPSKQRGSGFIQLDLEVMDEDAIQKFVDGRFREFSTRQGFDQFLCSFCGNDFAQEFCGHTPGQTVVVEGDEGKEDKQFKVFGITGPLSYREVSVVNIPGDKFTKVNELELIGADSLESLGSDDMVFNCNVPDPIALSELVLTDVAGTEMVDLYSSGRHTQVTADDRKRLTGKAIIAVSPHFNEDLVMGENMTDNDTKVEDEQVLDNTITNTETDPTSTSDGEPSPESAEEDSKEDVVVPDEDNSDSTEEANTSGLSAEDLEIGYKSLVQSNKVLESEGKTKDSEIKRLKGELTSKDEELERLKKTATDAQAAVKEVSAQILLDTRLILAKADVADVTDADTYKAKLQELGERTVDSLKDAIADLSPELMEFKASRGVTTADFVGMAPVENPVRNLPSAQDNEVGKTTEEKPLTRAEHIDNVL